ncbi:hypothetical protein C8R46DRAFT_518091, partial [Mycena filopes]
MTTTPCTNCGFIPGQHTRPDTLADVHDLRRQLSSLDATIAALTTERQNLQAKSDAVVYPILSLPTEITAEIFLRFCDSDVPPQPDPSQGPLLLAQICHQWRQVAICTAEIWRSLHLAASPKSVELLTLWLDRSGNLPLDLTLQHWETGTAEPLVQASILHAHHWQDIKFVMPANAYSTLNLENASLPMLRSISLDLIQPSPELECVVRLVNAPSLREALFREFPPANVDLVWSQLTSLRLPNHTALAACISTLRGCPQLVKLSVSTVGDVPLHTNPVVLPSLESLECNLQETASLLEHLTSPHLHSLVFLRIVEPENAPILKAFIRRSACSLRAVSISCFGLTHDTLTAYLRALPASVADLSLSVIGPAPLITALAPMDILPELTILHLRGAHPTAADYQHIMDMLHARLQPSPPRLALEAFTLHFNSLLIPRFMPTESTLAQLRAFAAAGLKVKFTMSGKHVGVRTNVVLDSWSE